MSKIRLVALCALMLCNGACAHARPRASAPSPVPSAGDTVGAAFTGRYPNLFVTLLGRDSAEVRTRIEAAWRQLFHGDSATQRVYYAVPPDEAYIADVLHRDVRSEGMSYGMMIALQLDKRGEFDALWKWARSHMQHAAGPRAGYFAWEVRPDGTIMDPNPASDGEEWFVTALLLASARWGDGADIFAYSAEAQRILDAMLHRSESPDALPNRVTDMFDRQRRQVVFVPETPQAATFTDPSYHLPHFYELWARRATRDRASWCAAIDTSRAFLRRAVHPATGLAPDYATFEGAPFAGYWGGGHDAFRFDAWRVAMNVAMDHVWFDRDPWQVQHSERLLAFFRRQGLERYVNQYALNGQPLSSDRSPGLVAANAVAALASTSPDRADFVRALWDMPVPSGPGRYYDGLLYLLGMLEVSGNFRVYGALGPGC